MAEIEVIIQAGNEPGAPRIAVRGKDAQEIAGALAQLSEQGIYSTVGRASASFELGERMGRQLDATAISSEPTPAPAPVQQPPATPPTPAPATPPPAGGRPKPSWA